MPRTPLVRRPNVLVVDDQRANVLALEEVLGADHNVLYAASGPEAIRFLQGNRIVDVILMDVQMPVMDGFEAASRIKKIPECEDIPIIFVTAVYNEDPFIKKGYEVGGIDYFSKPFDPEILKLKLRVYASFRVQADILRKRERHIHESEALLRAGQQLSRLVKRLAVGVLVADAEGRFHLGNDALKRMLKAQEPMPAADYADLLRWWDPVSGGMKDVQDLLARAMRGERSRTELLHVRCFDESAKTLLASASALRDPAGQIAGGLVVIQDASETKAIEDDLEDRITKLIALGTELEEDAKNQSAPH
jgi:CheY-like chemotaxis protein